MERNKICRKMKKVIRSQVSLDDVQAQSFPEMMKQLYIQSPMNPNNIKKKKSK